MLLYADGEEIQGQGETDLKVKVKIVLGFAIPEKCALAQWPKGGPIIRKVVGSRKGFGAAHKMQKVKVG